MPHPHRNLLQCAAQLVLHAEVGDVAQLWHTGGQFAELREHLLRQQHAGDAATYLQLAYGLLTVWQNEPSKVELRDNALLTTALALEIGLDEPADLDEAAQRLFSEPLAIGDVATSLASRCK
jgi:hypothetical protein